VYNFEMNIDPIVGIEEAVYTTTYNMMYFFTYAALRTMDVSTKVASMVTNPMISANPLEAFQIEELTATLSDFNSEISEFFRKAQFFPMNAVSAA